MEVEPRCCESRIRYRKPIETPYRILHFRCLRGQTRGVGQHLPRAEDGACIPKPRRWVPCRNSKLAQLLGSNHAGDPSCASCPLLIEMRETPSAANDGNNVSGGAEAKNTTQRETIRPPDSAPCPPPSILLPRRPSSEEEEVLAHRSFRLTFLGGFRGGGFASFHVSARKADNEALFPASSPHSKE